MIILFSILAFVMVLIVLNSFVFSIQEVRADCLNSLNNELCDRVIAASDIKLNKNILFLSENKAVENINSQMPEEVRVINIERKFPDKVWIHFVKLVPVIALEKGNGDFVTCDNNLNVIGSAVSGSSLLLDASVDAVDKNIDSEVRPVVLARVGGNIVNPAPKAALALSDANSLIALRSVVDTVNRLDYREYDFVRLLREIDMTHYDDAVNPVIYLKMRESGARSITIEIQNTKKMLLQKVQHSISAYEQYLADKLTFSTTNWTVYNNNKNEIIIAG